MKDRLQNAKAAFLVDYQGLDVETLNSLRNELRQTGSEFQVVKNRLGPANRTVSVTIEFNGTVRGNGL